MKKKQSVIITLISTLVLSTTTFPIIGFTNEQSSVPAAPPDGGGMGGADTMTYDYTGEMKGSLIADNQEIEANSEKQRSDGNDENTALVKNGGTLSLEKSTLEKAGASANEDNSNFYGLNSILLAVNENSFAYLSNSQLTANDKGSNGLFATDSGTIYANDNTIATESDNSRGMDATYGGTIIANKTSVSTKGDHSAALATDRGGGNVSVTDSQLATQGSGSPLLYSTGDIEVSNVKGTATGSQIAGMEGYNSIQIYNSELISKLTGTTGSDPVANGVIIYQSTSGDAEASTGETANFEAVNSTLKSATEGTMFYVTNTEANIILKDNTLDFDSDKAALLTIQGNNANNWGTAGSNGGKVNFIGINQELSGKISVDSISSLNLFLTEETTYNGETEITANEVNTAASETPITVTIDKTSKWVMTADSQITNLNLETGGEIVDEDGKSATIIADGETVVEGTGSTALTVTGTYSTQTNLNENNQLSEPSIDRTDFDQHYHLSTSFTNESNTTKTSNTKNTVAEVTSSVKKPTTAVKSNKQENYPLWIAFGGVVIIAGALVLKKMGKRTKRRH